MESEIIEAVETMELLPDAGEYVSGDDAKQMMIHAMEREQPHEH